MFRHLFQDWVLRHVVSPRLHSPLSRKGRRLLGVECLEGRDLMAAGITAWIDTSKGVLNVSGTGQSDIIQVRFANHQVQVLDGKGTKPVDIRVTTGASSYLAKAIDRELVPYYVLVSTGEGSNQVGVLESATDPARPLTVYGGQG